MSSAFLSSDAHSAVLNGEILSASRRHGRTFAAAKPFPHLILDNLFDRAFLRRIAAEFASVPSRDWNASENKLERKRGTRPGRTLPPATQAYFDLIYSGAFLRWVTAVTAIPWLIGDPWLVGGGMHFLPSGGFFDIHVDFQRHPISGLDTRLVLLTFLNDGWKDEYGGALELWEHDCSSCAVRIVPALGRTVLFRQGLDTPHGVPDPVRAPAGAGRMSLAAYYYTGERRSEADALTTRFLNTGTARTLDQTKWMLKRWTPPIILDAAREILGRKPPWRRAAKPEQRPD